MIDAELKAYLDARFEAQAVRFEAHAIEHTMLQRAIDAAKEAVSERLERMNEFRAQLETQAATFATRESVEMIARDVAKVDATVARIVGVGAGLTLMFGLAVAAAGLFVGLS